MQSGDIFEETWGGHHFETNKPASQHLVYYRKRFKYLKVAFSKNPLQRKSDILNKFETGKVANLQFKKMIPVGNSHTK